MQIDILYEDAALLVVNKPSGLPVHGGPKGGENVEDWAKTLVDPRRRAPQLGHRLDRDTSGCLALGKTVPALRRLNHIFATRQVEKTYWAITRGVPAEEEGVIDAPLAKRTDVKTSWWMEINPDGQEAKTHYKVLARHDGHAFIECRPLTGRTHQIRVHLAHLGAPLLGDAVYGRKIEGETFWLHARSLLLPFDAPPVFVEADASQGFQDTLARLSLMP